MAVKRITKTKKQTVSAAEVAAKRDRTKKKATPRKSSKTEEVTKEEIVASPSRIKVGRRTFWVVVAVLVLAGLLYLASKYLVIAWVDGKPVSRFEYYSLLDKKYGNDTKEQLIVERLILDEGQRKGVIATAQDIASESATIEKQQGGKEQLDQILQMQGLTRDEFNKLVRLQVLRVKMFGQNIQVSDQEVKNYIDQNKEQFTETSPTVVEQVREQLKQQKINQAFSDWLKKALQSSRVIRVNP